MSEPFFMKGKPQCCCSDAITDSSGHNAMCLCPPKSHWFAIYVRNSDASLAIERDFAVTIASEARKVSQELAKQTEYALIAVSEVGKKNQKLQESCTKIMHTVAIIQQEKDTTAHAASEAMTSTLKAGEVLTEVLGSFKPEMAKA